jgi:ElaB/YqjD/DUF883 family membrane-anchored ribosome-binding protein
MQDMLPGEKPGERIERLAKSTGKSIMEGTLTGAGKGIGHVVESVTKNPWTSAGIGAAVTLPLLAHYLLTRKRKTKTAGFFGKMLSNNYNIAKRSLPLTATVAGVSLPATVAGAKAYQSLQNPDSVGSMLVGSPEQLTDRVVSAAKPVVDNFINSTVRYPLEHPGTTAAIAGLYGLGAYALYRLLRKPAEASEDASSKTAGYVGKLLSAAVPLSMFGYATASTVAPTATGDAMGYAAGKAAGAADRHVGDNVVKNMTQSALSDTDAGMSTYRATRDALANNPVAKFVNAHPVASTAMAATAVPLLYYLLRRPASKRQAK